MSPMGSQASGNSFYLEDRDGRLMSVLVPFPLVEGFRKGKKRWTDHEKTEGNDLEVKREMGIGGEKRNKMARNRARFNFQRINLGNTYNSGGYESKDFF